MKIARGSLGLILCVLCTGLSSVTAEAQTGTPAQPPPAAAAPPPPTPVSFDAALLKAKPRVEISTLRLFGGPR
jgi:hypothetical protein